MQPYYDDCCNTGRGFLRLFVLAWLLNLGLAVPNASAGLTFTQVAAGGFHTCGLTTSGGVWCWGDNEYGQLGDGTITYRFTPVAVQGLSSGVTAIAAGYYHTCAVKSGGAMLCWGYNYYGQLGITSTNQTTPVAVVGLSSGVTAIAAGSFHTCAIKNGGALCWGSNDFGELGDGTTTDRSTPVAVSGLTSGVTAITAGGTSGGSIDGENYYTCALKNGGMQCWGNNEYGQLGDGTTTNHLTPVAVIGLSSGVTAMAAGKGRYDNAHICALKSGGAMLCWGKNSNGALGDGTYTNRIIPTAVLGLSSGVIGIAAGSEHTCALKNGGAVQCWGANSSGQLGDGTTIWHNAPISVPGFSSGVAVITAGDGYTCVIKTNGTMWCWGAGPRGDGTVTGRTTPVAVSSLTSGVTAIAAGSSHTCASHNGAAKCWGYNYSGQIGDGTTTSRITPVAVQGLASGVTAIAAGNSHTCALQSSVVKCWGRNWEGQLGDGTTTYRYTPVAVLGLTSGVTAITAGSDHTCTLHNGAAKCWGNNYYGQLGDGTTTNRSTPVAVLGLTSGVTAIAAGYGYTCAVHNGAAKCWGANASGQLGNGTTSWSATPVPAAVLGLTNGVTAIEAGGDHTCVVHNSAVKCWGRNWEGQLGDGTIYYRSTSPVAVQGLTSGVTAITAGGYNTCALKTGGAMLCWGSNFRGQLGNGTITDRSTPVAVLGLVSGVTAITVGGYHTCAIKTGGNMQCWGYNYYGQLGNGAPLGDNTIPTTVSAAYILTPSATGNGNIDPRTQVAVAANAKQEFILTVNPGYHASVSGTCGGNLAWGFIYTTNPINANCSVIATFTTGPTAPTVLTNVASGITATSATLNGSVTSNGATATATFEFGTTTSYGTSLAAGTVNSATPVAVSVTKTGLTCGKTYHYRLKAVNSAGTGLGTDRIVTTAACPAPDFVVTGITLTPVSPAVNGTFTAAVIVKNQGTAVGAGRYLDVWNHQPAAQVCGAEGIQWQTVGTLAAGASKTLTFTGLPARTIGNKTFRAFVDSGCGTAESNEVNNQLTKIYTVQ